MKKEDKKIQEKAWVLDFSTSTTIDRQEKVDIK